ncbi:MAG: hypothetical protein GZ094_19640 [Mariniphaga sp.]|nr:hypothetical protein [Mariniphaga sp.]
MSEHRFILEPYKGLDSRHICPGCKDKNRTFVLYIDCETGAKINPNVGRCNRLDNCGYHYPPAKYFKDNDIIFDTTTAMAPRTKTVQKPTFFMNTEILKASLQINKTVFQIGSSNNLVKFLIQQFGEKVTAELIAKYFIGSSNHWTCSSIFWQVDSQGKIRTGKVMQYNAINGHRIKEPNNRIAWEHTAIKPDNTELKQCLFGEHLLRDRIKPVAICESEKTAIIASVYLPQYIWLATGGLENLSSQKCEVLKGRKIILYPDLKAYDKWRLKAKEINEKMIGTRFLISEYLERIATEKERSEGYDIADYLLMTKPIQVPIPTPPAKVEAVIMPIVKIEPDNSIFNINELESYFDSVVLPTQIKLNAWTMINDTSFCINAEIAVLKSNAGNRIKQPSYERLLSIKQYLIDTIN